MANTFIQQEYEYQQNNTDNKYYALFASPYLYLIQNILILHMDLYLMNLNIQLHIHQIYHDMQLHLHYYMLDILDNQMH